MSTWVVWQTLNLTHKSFCHFFVLSPRPHVASLDTPPGAIRHSILNTLFTPMKSLLGVKKWNLKFGSFTPPKWKIGTLSWRLVESCSRRNSGTKVISTSNLEQVSTAEVASGNMAPRSKGHVTYSIKKCNNSVLGGYIKFILGCWHEDDPQLRTQNGCHDNACCHGNGATKSAIYGGIFQKPKGL